MCGFIVETTIRVVNGEVEEIGETTVQCDVCKMMDEVNSVIEP